MSSWTVDAILWDFDGVLVDTWRDIANAANYTLDSLGLEQLPPERIATFIGGGAEPLIRKCLAERADELMPTALPAFIQRYNEVFFVETCLYPGAREVLEHYHQAGKIQAIATNKIERITRGILKGLDLTHYFKVLVGPESITHRKPHPEAIFKILDQIHISPERAVMVGDTAADLVAGKNAGTLTLGVTYGYGSRAEVEDTHPDIVIDRLMDMLPAFQ